MAPRLRTRDRARSLRRTMTQSEVWLWVRIRRAPGLCFRRQHPFGPFILDFYCPEARLAVEVDGSAHNGVEQQALDAGRERWLREQGVSVLRLTAKEVLAHPDLAAARVIERARAVLDKP